MNFQLTKKALLSALDQLAKIIPTKSTHTALTSVQVLVSDAGLRLSGTNLEVDLQIDVPAEVGLGGPGTSFTVPAHLWHAVVAKLPAEQVELTKDGNTLHIRAGGVHNKIQLGQPEEAMALSFPVPDAGYALDGVALAAALNAVLYAASADAFQAIFRGILLEMRPDRVQVVASDGYRVAVHKLPIPEGLTGPHNLIIPRRNAMQLLPLLAGPVQLHLGEGLITISSKTAQMNVKLLYGDFPDYERVIPRDIRIEATLPVTSLRAVLERASLFSDVNANHRVEFTLADGRLQVSAMNDYGETNETLDVTQTGHEPALNFSLNGKYLGEALKPVVGDVLLSLNQSTMPVRITAPGNPDLLAVLVALK